MRNSNHFDLFSPEDRYIFCVYNPTPPVHRTNSDTASSTPWALAGRTADVTGRMWPASPGSNRYLKTTRKQMIH